MNLHALTNPDRTIQDKMRFFADYFSFANEFLGRLPALPFDNPLSLTEKMVFQLNTNPERCQTTVDNLIGHLLKYENDYLEKSVDSYSDMKTSFILPWNKCAGATAKKKWLLTNVSAIDTIVAVKSELNEKLFETILNWLGSYMMCVHSLSHHLNDIKFATQILVSYFRLSGATKKEIDEYIQRILSDDKYKFPLPLQILEKNKAEDFNAICEHFFASRDFASQFDGLKNVIQARKTRKGYFLFPIVDVNLDKEVAETFLVTFDKVTFISPQHAKLKAIKEACEEDGKNMQKEYSTVFFGENRLLGCVELYYEQRDVASIRGREIVTTELEQFNAYLNRGKAEMLDGSHFFYTDDFTAESWRMSTQIISGRSALVDEDALAELSTNSFQRLRTVSSKAGNQITRNEQTFFRAYKQDDVSAYWLYIESLFWLKTEDKKQIKNLFVKLAMQQVYKRCWRFQFYTGHLLNPYDRQNLEGQTGLSEDEANFIYKATVGDQLYPFDWTPYKNKIVHPFLIFIIDMLQNLAAAKANGQWAEFFKDIIQELFDYRNTDLHSGIVNELSRIKLATATPDIVADIRNCIIDTAEEHPELSFEQVIDYIIEVKVPEQ